jgi:hypothetical protein
MEQRAWITITEFPAPEDEEAWGTLMGVLERDSGDYGPVLSWSGPGVA